MNKVPIVGTSRLIRYAKCPSGPATRVARLDGAVNRRRFDRESGVLAPLASRAVSSSSSSEPGGGARVLDTVGRRLAHREHQVVSPGSGPAVRSPGCHHPVGRRVRAGVGAFWRVPGDRVHRIEAAAGPAGPGDPARD
jgi:hypothetical protein